MEESKAKIFFRGLLRFILLIISGAVIIFELKYITEPVEPFIITLPPQEQIIVEVPVQQPAAQVAQAPVTEPSTQDEPLFVKEKESEQKDSSDVLGNLTSIFDNFDIGSMVPQLAEKVGGITAKIPASNTNIDTDKFKSELKDTVNSSSADEETKQKINDIIDNYVPSGEDINLSNDDYNKLLENSKNAITKLISDISNADLDFDTSSILDNLPDLGGDLPDIGNLFSDIDLSSITDNLPF